MDAPVDSFPIDTHIFGDGASWQVCGKPADSEIKILGKSAAEINPRDISDENTMCGAFDAVRIIGDLNEVSSPVKPSPNAVLSVFLVVALAAYMNRLSSLCYSLGLAWIRM